VRDSAGSSRGRAICGSERTVVARFEAVDRRTSRRRAPTSVGRVSQSRRQGRPIPSGFGCYRPSTHGSRATEESRHMLSFGRARVSSRRSVVECGGLRAVRRDRCRSPGRRSRTMCQGRWRRNGHVRPVLKHGPRSLTCARVCNESESHFGARGESVKTCIIDRPILFSGRFE